MITDVSEIKDFRHCKRKWQLGSRNSFHLRPIVTPSAFKMGTVFHECLHKLYLGKDKEEVIKYLEGEMLTSDPKETLVLKSMVSGYAREVMPEDAKFKVLDIEHHFKFKPFDLLDDKGKELAKQLTNGASADYFLNLEIAGSIDMIALNLEDNTVWGFEHKTAKNFRNSTYLWLDEQPRVYYAALQQWVDQYNMKQHEDWATKCTAMRDEYLQQYGHAVAECEYTDVFKLKLPEEPAYPPAPPVVKLGGVYINEVRKLVRAFDYRRSALKYPEDDLRNFLLSFLTSCAECHKYATNEDIPRIPSPDMMTCQTCQYNTICQTFQYQNLTKDKVLTEFKLEFEERKQDHLDEKEEVTT